jgi:hypothetical protein
MDEKNLINKDKNFPYLNYRHPLAVKLLMIKIHRYNKKAKKWNYNTRSKYIFEKGYAITSPMFFPKFDEKGRFWKNFLYGYRNQFLKDLEADIILESTSLNMKMPYYKRIIKLIRFCFNV